MARQVRILKDIADLPWVARELSTSQSLTHAAGARGPIWLVFDPAGLHGCTRGGSSQ